MLNSLKHIMVAEQLIQSGEITKKHSKIGMKQSNLFQRKSILLRKMFVVIKII